MDSMSQVNSCETAIAFEIQARVGTSASSSGHSAAIGSDITLTSTFEPFSYHGEYYSYILVDGVRTREDKEFYIAQEDEDYALYEYQTETDEWHRSTLTRAEVLALPLKTGLIQDWPALFTNLKLDTDGISLNGHEVILFTGEVPSYVIQELIGDQVFGSFLYSMEHLINDMLPIELYLDAETCLPVQIVLDFTDEFIVNDMDFDSASIIVTYSNWNEYNEIEIPKKVSIIASDPDEEFYATYFAWNLFLPYINGGNSNDNPGGGGSVSFTSSWETFQVRIDQAMTSLPLDYDSLYKLGYIIDDTYDSNILEPNSFIDHVPVLKGRDVIYCAFYNPNTNPQPITECFIGSIDISASDQLQNSINIYLPGEVTLGITRDSLLAAYGDADTLTTGFSSDVYLWKGDSNYQSFMAEVSPVSGQVIRICIKNIPISTQTDTESDTNPTVSAP